MSMPHSSQIVPVTMLIPPGPGGQGTSLLTMKAEEVAANMMAEMLMAARRGEVKAQP